MRPYRIGLTGNIACGKSTVLRELARLGAATLDADAVVHELLQPGTPVYTAVVETFGPTILGPTGQIDRSALGRIVFADPAALARLEAIIHPAVLAYTDDWLKRVTAPVAVVDAVKLIESGIADSCDEVWVVVCPPEERLRRLVECRGMSREEALQRIRAQPAEEEKVARADVVIDNSGRREHTKAQVREAWARLQRLLQEMKGQKS